MEFTIQPFLDQVISWGKQKASIQAIALVGSHARGNAAETSDVDLVFLADSPEVFLVNRDWINQFGKPYRQQVEDYGRLTSLRVWYINGPEVEYGIYPNPASQGRSFDHHIVRNP